MQKYDLDHINDNRSFGGKAKVLMDEKANLKILLSYDTPVIFIKDGAIYRCSDMITSTTLRHINAFLYWVCDIKNGMSKKDIMGYPLSNPPKYN